MDCTKTLHALFRTHSPEAMREHPDRLASRSQHVRDHDEGAVGHSHVCPDCGQDLTPGRTDA